VNGWHDINGLESAFEENKKKGMTFFRVQGGLRGNDAIIEKFSLIKIAQKNLIRVNVVMKSRQVGERIGGALFSEQCFFKEEHQAAESRNILSSRGTFGQQWGDL